MIVMLTDIEKKIEVGAIYRHQTIQERKNWHRDVTLYVVREASAEDWIKYCLSVGDGTLELLMADVARRPADTKYYEISID